MSSNSFRPTDILLNAAVREAITTLAKTSKDVLVLEHRASDIVDRAQALEGESGRELKLDAYVCLATAAVSERDPKAAALAAYQDLIGWFGPTNVPEAILKTMEVNWSAAPDYIRDDAQSPTLDGLRVPQEVQITAEVATTPAADLARLQNDAALADKAVLDAEEVHRALGQLEGLEFARRVADVAAAQIFLKIKEGKKYNGLPYRDAEGRVRHVASLEEFCEVKLGKSLRRVQELASNLHHLGPELYEAAETVGFKSRDYRALKALPEAEQETVKQALASETKEEVLAILEDLAERHASEREAMRRENEGLKGDLDAKDKVLENKARSLDRVEVELEKLKSLPPNESTKLRLAQEEQAVEALNRAHIIALSELHKFLIQASTILEAEGVTAHTQQYCTQTVSLYCEDIVAALAKHGIPVDFEEIVNPAWARDTAKAEIKAEVEAGK